MVSRCWQTPNFNIVETLMYSYWLIIWASRNHKIYTNYWSVTVYQGPHYITIWGFPTQFQSNLKQELPSGLQVGLTGSSALPLSVPQPQMKLRWCMYAAEKRKRYLSGNNTNKAKPPAWGAPKHVGNAPTGLNTSTNFLSVNGEKLQSYCVLAHHRGTCIYSKASLKRARLNSSTLLHTS